MRRFLLAAVMFGATSGTQAADMPDFLRGSFPGGPSTATRNWDGWYVGGQVGYTSAETDFGRSIVGLTNHLFRNSVLQQPTAEWSVLNKTHTQNTNFGAFVGRNYQWDDLVFSVEANYNYMNRLASASSGSLALAIVNPPGSAPPPNHTYTYNTSLEGGAAVVVKDVLTLRGRAGWAAGDFLPYVFGGVAVGRMQVSRSVSSNVVLRDDEVAIVGGVPVTLPPVFSAIPSLSTTIGEERTNSFVAGWTGGLGVEYLLYGNLFMRGEWEYIKFLKVKDTVVTLNSVRAGIGYKF
ncbi:outer membrane protein [Bradyrhizobium sp. URHD0069]|uniref:outer membrane protein n=1 Tax=Bradyrhizobium sp. URHD0069 TaxID=1380355 RepID=UPI000495319B|nr:outer membrane beta-barrel protein [Bradyrhizobium sp. URHD0069]